MRTEKTTVIFINIIAIAIIASSMIPSSPFVLFLVTIQAQRDKGT
jgi:hypothetical protein